MRSPPITGRVRSIFIAAVALFTAQTLFIKNFVEPYPALVMPGFPGSGGYRDGRVESSRTEAVFVAGGREFAFPSRVLLEEFPGSQHGAIERTALRPPSEAPQSAEERSRMERLRGSWLGRLQQAVFPGFGPGNRSRDVPRKFASLQAWLRGRARALVPDRPVDRVEIRWYRETLSLEGGKAHIEREPTSTLVIPLEGEPR